MNKINQKKIIPFYGHSKHTPYHWYSQFYASKFTYMTDYVHETLLLELNTKLNRHECNIDLICIENQEFFCAEQFMIMGKVLIFNPLNRLDYLKNATTPSKCKAYGRSKIKISNYNDAVWKDLNLIWVTIGNYLKFTQSMELNAHIIDSGDAILVEGSKHDRIWGVGLEPTNSLIHNPDEWKGQNKLGQALMTTRDLINNIDSIYEITKKFGT
tara:strand:+ start:109 stop:747 length:639 start_codon:yes stop_codon:yes gene_type:complete